MTEKELLYFEDAIGHVSNIENLLNDFLANVKDEKINDFFTNEREILISLKNNLTSVLGGKANG